MLHTCKSKVWKFSEILILDRNKWNSESLVNGVKCMIDYMWISANITDDYRLSVIITDYLLLELIICDYHRLSAINTDYCNYYWLPPIKLLLNLCLCNLFKWCLKLDDIPFCDTLVVLIVIGMKGYKHPTSFCRFFFVKSIRTWIISEKLIFVKVKWWFWRWFLHVFFALRDRKLYILSRLQKCALRTLLSLAELDYKVERKKKRPKCTKSTAERPERAKDTLLH